MRDCKNGSAYGIVFKQGDAEVSGSKKLNVMQVH